MFGDKVNPFSFQPMSAKERAELETANKEVRETIKRIADTAAECLSSDAFAKYREEYAKGERVLIDTGIQLNLTDPMAYNMVARTIFTNLKVLKMLGDMVMKDAHTK